MKKLFIVILILTLTYNVSVPKAEAIFGIGSAIKSTFGGIGDAVGGTTKVAVDITGDLFGAVFDAIKEVFGGAAEEAKKTAGEQTALAREQMEALERELADDNFDLLDEIRENGGLISDEERELVLQANIFNEVIDVLEELVRNEGIMSQDVDGFVDVDVFRESYELLEGTEEGSQNDIIAKIIDVIEELNSNNLDQDTIDAVLDLLNGITDISVLKNINTIEELLNLLRSVSGDINDDFDIDTLEAILDALRGYVADLLATTNRVGSGSSTGELDPALRSLLDRPTNDFDDETIENVLDEFRNNGYFDSSVDPNTGEITPSILSESAMRALLKQIYGTALSPYIDPTTGDPIGFEESIEILITPINPGPGDTISIEVNGFSVNLASSFIEWSNNGNILASGFGVDVLTGYKLNNEGIPEYIDLYIRKNDGGEITRTIKITPSEIDLIYEPLTTTHSQYLGKPVFTHESTIKLIALPQLLNDSGNRINPANLEYTWRVNSKVVEKGLGKSYIYYNSPFISDTLNVSVDVKLPGSDIFSSKGVALSPGQPAVLIYENNPIYGVLYERAITSQIQLDRQELEVKAVPYSFSPNDLLDYNWYINNDLTNIFNSDNLTLRNDSGDEGISNIMLEIQNANKRLQYNEKIFDIIFR